MEYFAIKLGLNDSGLQNDLVAKLKTAGASTIQTSDGILIRASQDTSQISELVKSVSPSLTVRALDREALLRDSATAPDVVAFLN